MAGLTIDAKLDVIVTQDALSYALPLPHPPALG